ncbi:Serine/threonine-protein kinase Sgk1 [Dinochytrium kinnereticum]|nr:Serine/threonine-protein kinase Sgk1 [Dinochytrium kinnereticum]
MISWSKSEVFFFKRRSGDPGNLLRSRSSRKRSNASFSSPSSSHSYRGGDAAITSSDGIAEDRGEPSADIRALNRVTKLAGFFGIPTNDGDDDGMAGGDNGLGSQSTIAPVTTPKRRSYMPKIKRSTLQTPDPCLQQCQMDSAGSMDELLSLLNIIERRGSVLEGLVSRRNSMHASSKEGWLSFHDGHSWSPAWCYIRNSKFHIHLGTDRDTAIPVLNSVSPASTTGLQPIPLTPSPPHQNTLCPTRPPEKNDMKSPWTTRMEEGLGNRLVTVHSLSLLDDSFMVEPIPDTHPAVVDGMKAGSVSAGSAFSVGVCVNGVVRVLTLAAFCGGEAERWVDRISTLKGQIRRRLSSQMSTRSSTSVMSARKSIASAAMANERADSPKTRECDVGNACEESVVNMSMVDFEIHKVLGKGKYGTKSTDRVYAVKMVAKNPPISPNNTTYDVHLESEVLRSVQPHPSIVTLHAAFESPTHLYMAMDYINGGELYFHVANFGRFDEARVRFYAGEVLSGVGFLHEKGIVYRDLKLENLLLSRDGHVKLTDFGLCRRAEVSDRGQPEILGTLEYLAPEVLRGEGTSFSSDWWAFGIVIHEMLFALHPFHDDDPTTIITNIHTKPLTLPPAQLSTTSLSITAHDLLRKLLERDPERRIGGGELRGHAFFVEEEEEGEGGLRYVPEVDDELDVRFFDEIFTEMPVPVDVG